MPCGIEKGAKERGKRRGGNTDLRGSVTQMVDTIRGPTRTGPDGQSVLQPNVGCSSVDSTEV